MLPFPPTATNNNSNQATTTTTPYIPLPPHEDDLYVPSNQTSHAQLASVVWSVIRLSYTTADHVWCKVCHQWLRVRLLFLVFI